MDRFAEAGCDDALVGIGQPGRLALEFVREVSSAHDAIEGAIEDVWTCPYKTGHQLPVKLMLPSV